MDIISKAVRSKNMSNIRSTDTVPEVTVRRLLHSMGYRFRLHKKGLPGNPDICLPKYKTIIFVHGCFWHHHPNCKDGHFPKSNRSYWMPKINRNINRDKNIKRELKKLGWKVIIIWGCEIKNTDRVVKKLQKSLV